MNCAPGPQLVGQRVPLQGEVLAQVEDAPDQCPTGELGVRLSLHWELEFNWEPMIDGSGNG